MSSGRDRSIEAVIARLRFGDSDGDDHDIAAAEIECLDALLSIALDRNAEHCAEVQRLQRDLEIQAVNATAVLQAQHERDCAVEALASARQLLEDWMLSSDNFDLEAWVLRVRDMLEASNPFNSQDTREAKP